MADNAQVVRQLMDACMNKDFDTVRKLVHPQYTLKDPMMQLNGPEELIAMMRNCPGDGKMEDLTVIADGDRVASTFTTTMPGGAPMRMCSVVRLENGKVRSEEMFYDSAKIPQEMKDAANQGGKKAA